MMKAAPPAPFIITEAEFLLELLIIALDPPSQLCQVDQAIEGNVLVWRVSLTWCYRSCRNVVPTNAIMRPVPTGKNYSVAATGCPTSTPRRRHAGPNFGRRVAGGSKRDRTCAVGRDLAADQPCDGSDRRAVRACNAGVRLALG